MSEPRTYVDLLGQMIADYIDCRDNEQSELVRRVDGLIVNWIKVNALIANKNREYGGNFNPFAKLRVKETQHSRLLGDLLNPSGSHGQGDLFLKPFLEYLGVPNPGTGEWHVAVENDRVDIMLWRGRPTRSAVIIENKSNNAGDQENQIYRYWHHQIYLWDRSIWDLESESDEATRSRLYHLVYLPTDGGKSPAPHSLERPKGWESANPHERVPLECKTVSLSSLMQIWIEQALPHISSKNVRLRIFLEQYQDLWKI